MNWDERSWTTYKVNAKLQWSKLSDEELSSKLQQAYGISKEETEKQVAEWQLRLRDQQRAQSVQQ